MYQLQGRYLQNQVQFYEFYYVTTANDEMNAVQSDNAHGGDVRGFLLLFLYFCFSQGIIWPQVITGAVGNILNAIINYVFLYRLELGVA